MKIRTDAACRLENVGLLHPLRGLLGRDRALGRGVELSEGPGRLVFFPYVSKKNVVYACAIYIVHHRKEHP